MLGSRDYARVIISAMADGKPRSAQDIADATNLDRSKVWTALSKLWRAGMVLRTDRPISENCKRFRGRHRTTCNTRLYHLYVLNEQQDCNNINSQRFMQFKSEYSDMRGSKGEKSKARLILNFLKNNQDRAFYSTEIYNALKDKQDDKKRYRAFVTFYNHEREHGGIGGTTPAEKFEKRLKRSGLQAKARQKVLPMLGTRSVTHVW